MVKDRRHKILTHRISRGRKVRKDRRVTDDSLNASFDTIEASCEILWSVADSGKGIEKNRAYESKVGSYHQYLGATGSP